MRRVLRSTRRQQRLVLWVSIALLGLSALRCQPASPAGTPTPTKTRVVPALPSATPVALIASTANAEASATPLSTATPLPPSATPTLLIPPATDTPWPTDTVSPPQPTADSGVAPAEAPPPTSTATAPATAPPPDPPPATATPTTSAQPALPPQQGGEWDMEAGFVAGTSPLGEDCPGWAVAVGWQAFLAPGTPASSCLNENKNPANVHSGERSQEITFDFISAEAGIRKRAQTIPGHRYQIEAWGKHVRSQSPVELSLGVDLTGGEDWQAASVMWYPWGEVEEEAWVHTQLTVRASGESLTIFVKGYHPLATQGGATLFDDVRVEDLGQ